MSIKKVKWNVWELKTENKTFYGPSRKDCLRQLEEWIKNGK